MSTEHKIYVPQLGEGLRYVTLRALYKNIGDWVDEDSDVAEVETEKANLSISSPKQGYISKIHFEVGQTIEVGAELYTIKSEKEALPALSVQPYSHSRPEAEQKENTAIQPLPRKQLLLINHMKSSQDIIQATIDMRINWENIDTIKKFYRGLDHIKEPISSLGIICWSIATAVHSFEKFRGQLIGDNLSLSETCNLGIAKAAPNDTIETNNICFSGCPSLEFTQGKLHQAINGTLDSAIGASSVLISDMSSFNIFSAAPVIVSPAVATICIGAPHWAQKNRHEACRYATISMSFDHRIMNGAYAAKFLQQVEQNIVRYARSIKQPVNANNNSEIQSQERA